MCNFVCFDGMRHFIKVLHNRILLKSVNDVDTCKPLRSLEYDISSNLETKYQTKEDMKEGLKLKLKDTIYYKFSSNSVLYKIDNIIKQKYDIHSSELLGFVVSIFISENQLKKFIDHFLKTLIKSHLYRNTDKLQLFTLLFTINSPKYSNSYKMFYLIKESIINSKYVISKMNKTSSNTLFYNLLSSNDDTHCHDFYNYVCCEYNQIIDRENPYVKFIHQT